MSKDKGKRKKVNEAIRRGQIVPAEIQQAHKDSGMKIIRNVPVDQIGPGRIQHEALSPLLTEMARELFARVGHLLKPNFEQWELGFMRDLWPWREILVWELICRALEAYMGHHPETTDPGQIMLDLCTNGRRQDIQGGRYSQEIRRLLDEAWEQRWTPILLLQSTFESAEGTYPILDYTNVIDEHDGCFDPSLKGEVDPRFAIADAEVILAMDSLQPSITSLIFGRDKGPNIAPGTRVLILSLDVKNTETRELEKILSVVRKIKGRHDYLWLP